jgi:hypothetical protein
VQFSFLRATKSTASAAVFAVALATPAAIQAAYGQTPPAGQPAQGQAAGQAQAAGQSQAGGQKNWKDRAEYDLYNSIAHEADPKKRLDLLNTWTEKYPKTDFEDLRSQAMVATLGPLSQQDPSLRQKAIDASKKLLQTKPNDFTALYWMAIDIPAVGGNSPTPEQLTDAQTAAKGLLSQADTVFSADKKPAQTSQADWDKAKNDIVALAHGTLGWVANANKDYPTAKSEYEAYLKANPNNANVSYQLGQVLVAAKKPEYLPEAMWCFARAASYDGAGAIPAANRQAVVDYFKKVYTQYHGSAEGSDQLMAQAKTTPLPPENFQIVSAADQANKQAEQINARLQSDPGFKVWYSIKQQLTGDNADAFFTQNVKGFEVPGGQEAKSFTGTVISLDPPDKPTKIVVAVEDPTKPDATLEFDEPLDVTPPIKVGDKLNFTGVADSFTKDPYMLTFKAGPENLPDEKSNKATTRKRPPARTRGGARPQR